MLETPHTPSTHMAYYPTSSTANNNRTGESVIEGNKKDVVSKARIPLTANPDLVDGKLAQQEDLKNRAKVVFGSRLTGPQRWDAINQKSEVIAGVRVPPKPEEPDTCCMSGCVNCVWDLFREDLEAWAAAKAEAQKALGKSAQKSDKEPKNGKEKKPRKKKQAMSEAADVTSINDDAGRAIIGSSIWEGFEDIPVGIRAFMETEKHIKTRRLSRDDVKIRP